MSNSSPTLSIRQIMELKFDELLNSLTEREKSLRMEMENFCNALKKENESLECSKRRMETMIHYREVEVERKQKRCEELEESITEMEEMAEKLSGEKSDVEERLEKSENANQRMEQEIVKLSSEKLKLEGKLGKCEALRIDENKRLGDEMEKLRRENLKLKENLERSERQCEELRPEIVEANKGMKKFKQKEIEEEVQFESVDKMRVKKMKLDMSGKSRLHDTEPMMTTNKANLVGVDALPLDIPDDTQDIGSSKKGAKNGASLRRYYDLGIIGEIKKYLAKENLQQFEQSCFGHFLKIDDLRHQGQLILQLLQQMDMDASNKERLVFKVNSSNLEFGLDDFHRVTGLHCGTATTSLPVQEGGDAFWGESRVSLKDVKERFLEEVSLAHKGRGKRPLQLALLYFLNGVLLTSRDDSKKIHLWIRRLVEDVHQFNTFPWGREAFDFLVSSIFVARKAMDDSQVSLQQKAIPMHGFVFALQIWAYEVIPRVAEYCASRADNFDNLSPQMLRWIPAKTRIRLNDLRKVFAVDDKTHLREIGRISTSSCAGKDVIFICDDSDDETPKTNKAARREEDSVVDWSRTRERGTIETTEDSDEDYMSDGYMNELVAKLKCPRSS